MPRGEGKAEPRHASPMQPLPSLPGWPIHLNLQLPTATRPDSHISISKAPVPTSCTHPLLPAHSLTSVCPQAGSWQAAFGTAVPSCLRRCWREQHPVSPNEPYLCLRLRKEFRLEFLLPHCQVLACHTAPFSPSPVCLPAWWPPAEAELPLLGHKAWAKHTASLWA